MCIFFLNFNFFISSDIVKKRLNLFDACPPGFVNIMMIPSFIFRWLWRVIDCMYVRLPSAYDYVLIMSCLIYALRPWRLYQGVRACVFVCTRSHWLVHDCLIAVLLTLIPSGRSHPLSFFFFFSHYLFSPLSSATKYQQERVCVGVSRIILRPLLHCPGVCSAPEQRFGSTGVLIFKNIFWVFNLFFRAKTILTISFMIKHSS